MSAITYSVIEEMSRTELQSFLARRIAGVKCPDEKEKLEAYFDGFYHDLASLTEMAYDFCDGVYNNA